MFQLSQIEAEALRSQFATSKIRGGRRYLPWRRCFLIGEEIMKQAGLRFSYAQAKSKLIHAKG